MAAAGNVGPRDSFTSWFFMGESRTCLYAGDSDPRPWEELLIQERGDDRGRNELKDLK